MQINVGELQAVGEGYSYLPSQQLYAQFDMENLTLQNAIFGRFIPNPVDRQAHTGNPCSPLVHLLWNDWKKRERQIKRQTEGAQG